MKMFESICTVFVCMKMLGISSSIKLSEDGQPKMMKIPAKKPSKSWIWISYLSKTWDGYFVTFLFSKKGIPLNILIPTPAPKHLLGGHSELNGTSVE